MPSLSLPTSFFRTLCWAVYLGCSWTWCIGMFLPVILVSEYGNAAWFVFAIPNVIGAAAMGWTLARPGASEKIVGQHRTACVAFSAVTLAFHLFFLFWLSSPSVYFIPVIAKPLAIAAVAGGLLFGFIGRRRIGLDFLLAGAVMLVSLVVFSRGLAHPVFGVAHPVELANTPRALLGLVPVCILGFGLCPYLDITFHRARQQTSPGAGKVAFGLGFGVVFLSMIVLTLMYAGDFADSNLDQRLGSFGAALLVTWVATHLAAQCGFTIAAHLRALPRFERPDIWVWAGAVAILVPAVFTAIQRGWLVHHGWPSVSLDGLFSYRLFMGFYGLVFPAYAWICMVPIRGNSPGPTRRNVMVFALAVVIAGPMFWLGFIFEWMLWLIPAVAVVILARVFTRSAPSHSPAQTHQSAPPRPERPPA
jgi:hypothetical protein